METTQIYSSKAEQWDYASEDVQTMLKVAQLPWLGIIDCSPDYG